MTATILNSEEALNRADQMVDGSKRRTKAEFDRLVATANWFRCQGMKPESIHIAGEKDWWLHV